MNVNYFQQSFRSSSKVVLVDEETLELMFGLSLMTISLSVCSSRVCKVWFLQSFDRKEIEHVLMEGKQESLNQFFYTPCHIH